MRNSQSYIITRYNTESQLALVKDASVAAAAVAAATDATVLMADHRPTLMIYFVSATLPTETLL